MSKKSNLKRGLLVFLCAVLMTSFIGAFPAYADSFQSGGHTVKKFFVPTNTSCTGGTTADYTAEYLVAILTSRRVNSSGDLVKPVMDDATSYNTKTSGRAYISSGSGYKFKMVCCTHGAKYPGYSETSSNSVKNF